MAITNPSIDVDYWTSTIAALLKSHRAQLALTAIASGVAVGSTMLALQSVRHNEKLRDIKRSIQRKSNATAVTAHSLLVHSPYSHQGQQS